MVCVLCGGQTEVVNSRYQKRNNQIWRRRRCKQCSKVFTTHELAYLPALLSVIRHGKEEPFLPDRLLTDILSSLKERTHAYSEAKEITATVTQNIHKNALEGFLTPQMISLEAAQVLKRFDKRAWLRFIAEHPSVPAPR